MHIQCTSFSRALLFSTHTVTSFFLFNWLLLDMRGELGRSTRRWRKIIWWWKSNQLYHIIICILLDPLYEILHVLVHLWVCNGRTVEAIWTQVKHVTYNRCVTWACNKIR